jgi:hypothetical protein
MGVVSTVGKVRAPNAGRSVGAQKMPYFWLLIQAGKRGFYWNKHCISYMLH